MSKGTVNRVILVGRLGNEPQVLNTFKGNNITRLSLATDDSYKNGKGDVITHTEWHRITLFNKLAEIAAQYLHKGSRIYLEGRLKTNKYVDKNEIERYSIEVIAESFQMLDSINTARTDTAGPPVTTTNKSNHYSHKDEYDYN